MAISNLEDIFNELAKHKMLPLSSNLSSKTQLLFLLFPNKHAQIMRSDLLTYYPKRNTTHWLLSVKLKNGNPLFMGEQIGFCSLFEQVRRSDRSNYIGGFFKHNQNDTALKYVFWNLLVRNGSVLLDEMEEKASTVLANANVSPETQLYKDLLQKWLPEWLRSLYKSTTHSYLYYMPQSKGRDADTPSARTFNNRPEEHNIPPFSDAVKGWFDNGLSSAISRIIASAAIVGIEADRQEQALNIIWSKTNEQGSWRDLIRQGNDYLSNGNARDALRLYDRAEDIAKSLPGIENNEEYQRLLIQQAEAALKAKELTQGMRRKLENLCQVYNSSYQCRALFIRGQLKAQGIGYQQSDAEAFSDYLAAANENNPFLPALQHVGQAFKYGTYGQEIDLCKAYDYLHKGHIYGDGSCSDELAKLCENADEDFLKTKRISAQDIKNFYQAAANQGRVSAKNRVRDINFKSNIIPSYEDGDILKQCICFTNDKNNEGNPYIDAFMSGDHNFNEVINLSKHRCIEAILKETPSYLRSEKLIFALMSQNYSQNTLDAVNLIRYLIDYCESDHCKSVKQREDWRRIDLYVLSTDESTPHIIDAAMDNVDEPIFFRTHILDPDVIATNSLLFKHPTFIPCIRSATYGTGHNESIPFLHVKPHDLERRIVIIGTNRLAFTLTKQILGCTYLSSVPTHISIIGENAQECRIRFLEECHGLSSVDVNIDFKPSFFTCPYNRIPINRNSALGNKETTIRNVLHNANYIVICTEDDELNLHLGIKLRSGLLAKKPIPDARPFIAIHYRQSAPGWLATQMAVHPPKQASYPWASEYALCVFGSYDDFNYLQLENSLLREYATRLHRSYYGDPQDEKAMDVAMRAFYMRSYNQSSSQAQALSIIYELFALGIYYDDPLAYSIANSHAALSKSMHYLITDGKQDKNYNDTIIETAGIIEHERWNCYMIANGWRTATTDDYQAYIRAGNEKHHLELAKLHPYIAPYNELEKIWRDLQNAFSANTSHYDKKLSDPREADRNYVKILHQLIAEEHQSGSDGNC